MGFSTSQQGVYRPLVKRAWETHSSRNGLDPKDKIAKDSWYRAELLLAIGRDTTTYANRSRDFDACKAHFEAICGDSINANMEVYKADAKRIIFLIGQICKKNNVSDAYVLGTARNILKNRELNNLHQIESAEDLGKIRIALIIHAKRKAKEALKAKAVPKPEAEEEQDSNYPF